MYLGVSAVLFAGFMINIIMGAIGYQPLLNDIGEMILLFLAVIIFVLAILEKGATKHPNLHI